MTVETDVLVGAEGQPNDGQPMDPGPRLSVVEIPPGLSPGRRRTLRRLQMIEMGRHPITTFPLHPDAPDDATRKDRYPRPVTCGTCVHLVVLQHHNKTYMKCDLTTMTHSENSDVRRWLPGCMSWRQAEEPVSRPVDSL